MSGRSAAIVGAGWVSRHCYVPAFQVAGISLRAVADTDLEAARSLAELAGGNVCRTLEEMLPGKPDLVVIATPNRLHPAHARQGLLGGGSVLCEKPLALTAREAADLVELGGERLFASTPYRFRDDVATLLDAVRGGAVGEVFRVSLSWTRARGIPRPGSWYTRAETSGGGVLADLGPHLLDLGLLLVGDRDVHGVHAWTAGRCVHGERAAGWMGEDAAARS
ncbi:MAG TPA: Gfo/Idh/MocA family oxidoreductase, partial [Longimicrobiaceae bacterium]